MKTKNRRGSVETPGLDALGPLQDIIRQVRRALPLVKDADLRRNLAPRVKGLVGLRPLLGGDGRGLRD